MSLPPMKYDVAHHKNSSDQKKVDPTCVICMAEQVEYSFLHIPPQNHYSHNVTRVMSGTHHPLEGISITWMVMACPTPNF